MKNKLKKIRCILLGHSVVLDYYNDWSVEKGNFRAGIKATCEKCMIFYGSHTI
jgi:hypothetical protein